MSRAVSTLFILLLARHASPARYLVVTEGSAVCALLVVELMGGPVSATAVSTTVSVETPTLVSPASAVPVAATELLVACEAECGLLDVILVSRVCGRPRNP